MRPVWEHGYRCHGYWLGTRRVGSVGLTPRVGPLRYIWTVFGATGTTARLAAAKRKVERLWNRVETYRAAGE